MRQVNHALESLKKDLDMANERLKLSEVELQDRFEIMNEMNQQVMELEEKDAEMKVANASLNEALEICQETLKQYVGN